MQDFHKLRAWCLADELADGILDTFPMRSSRRVTGLRGQIVRAAQSIPANLAEGCGRSGNREFIVFIDNAIGSANELENHLRRARKARIIPTDTHEHFRGKLIVLGKMLRSLRRSLEGDG